MSYVYFMRPVGQAGPIKIGCSGYPRNRLEDLSTWSPIPLEIVGSVPGSLMDEGFLHRCFDEEHSHREWFHASPRLIEIMYKILWSGSIDVARKELTPVRRTGKPRTAEQKLRMSYSHRVRWAEKRLRDAGAEAYCAPDDIAKMLQKWSGPLALSPTADEFARIEEYLADPEAHSVLPWWVREKQAAA